MCAISLPFPSHLLVAPNICHTNTKDEFNEGPYACCAMCVVPALQILFHVGEYGVNPFYDLSHVGPLIWVVISVLIWGQVKTTSNLEMSIWMILSWASLRARFCAAWLIPEEPQLVLEWRCIFSPIPFIVGGTFAHPPFIQNIKCRKGKIYTNSIAKRKGAFTDNF